MHIGICMVLYRVCAFLPVNVVLYRVCMCIDICIRIFLYGVSVWSLLVRCILLLHCVVYLELQFSSLSCIVLYCIALSCVVLYVLVTLCICVSCILLYIVLY